MTFVSCSIPERFVNPLFEVFDGGDFVLSSYRDIEEDFTRMRIFFEDPAESERAERALSDALKIVGVETTIEKGEIPDQDWRFAYRRHFKTELVSPRIYTVPEWEWESFKPEVENAVAIVSDPGMAFGTGKHETTKACLQFIDELSPVESFLDMGTGSGILSIAAAKLGCAKVCGFDVDEEAVEAAIENSGKNSVRAEFFRYGLGANVKRDLPRSELVAANILGPLLIRFADEIAPTVKSRLIISGILDTLYSEVLKAYTDRGFTELKRKTIGEWTTGLLAAPEIK